MAVSPVSAKPSLASMVAISSMPFTGKSTMKEGARLATTRCPPAMAAFTRSTSERTTLAFWGQVTTHWPQRMHSLPMILACWPENSMDFTGQTRMHLWQLLQLARLRPKMSIPVTLFPPGPFGRCPRCCPGSPR